MAITFDDLKGMLEKQGLKYFVAPDQPMVIVAGQGLFGFYQVTIALYEEGQFLQFRTMGYLKCDPNLPHSAAVHTLLASLNYQLRLVKFGWDPQDGEIVVYADHVVLDNSVSQAQFSQLMNFVMGTLDMNCLRLKTTIETGRDPGEMPQPPTPDAPKVDEI